VELLGITVGSSMAFCGFCEPALRGGTYLPVTATGKIHNVAFVVGEIRVYGKGYLKK
jgi:hypothetical protein